MTDDRLGRASRAHERDRRLTRRAGVASVVLHVLTFVLLAIFGTDARSLDIPKGFVVELVDIAEAVPEVRAPQQGAVPAQGEIRLPTDRRMPRRKPKARPETTRSETPKSVREVEKPPKVVPPVESATKGAGGRAETEVAFPFAYYTETVTRLILGHWAPSAGVQDSTKSVVSFYILRDGSVANLATVDPSGTTSFDREAVRAVQSVGRFPPLPDGFRHERLRIRFHFEYRRGY